jgi:DNA-binding MarR family transcriptional regulator
MNRATSTSEVLEELAAHQPAQVMKYMRRWPGGALSLVHLQVLMALDHDGALPMRRLAETMDVSQASATGIVDRMEQRGLVERQRDDEDRRVVRVALTQLGRTTIAGFATERRERLAEILDELTDEELAAFAVGLRGMRRAREKVHGRLQAEHEAANPGVRYHDTPAAEQGDDAPSVTQPVTTEAAS